MNGTLAGIIAILMWSSIACFIFFTENVPGLLLAFLTFFLGALIITSYQFIRREDVISYWKLPLKDLLFVVMGVGVYTSLFYVSFKLISPFEANTLNYLWPILLVLLTSFVHAGGFSLKVIFGSVLGLCGVISLFLPRDGQVVFANFEWGHFIAIMAAIIWTIYSVLSRDKNYSQGIMAPALFYSAIIALGFHFIFEETILPQGWQWMSIVVLGFLRIAYSFWDYGMKNGNVILLASLANFIPLISLLLLIAVGAGPDDSFIGLGAFLITFGCLIVNFDKVLLLFKSKKKIS